jgi:hypothetical protein
MASQFVAVVVSDLANESERFQVLMKQAADLWDRLGTLLYSSNNTTILNVWGAAAMKSVCVSG